MATDFWLVVGKDLKRIGFRGRGSNFIWLIPSEEIPVVETFEVWDDFGNTYDLDEFKRVLVHCDHIYPFNSESPALQVNFPNGTLDKYWFPNGEPSAGLPRYKKSITAPRT